MNKKRYLISVLAVFVFLIIFGWIFHGNCLKEIYSSTQHFWRPYDVIMNLIPYIYIGQLIFALLFCFIYTKGLEGNGSIGEGLRYGFLVALLIHIPVTCIRYVYLPYPTRLHIDWLIGGIVETVLAGLILGLIYRKPSA